MAADENSFTLTKFLNIYAPLFSLATVKSFFPRRNPWLIVVVSCLIWIGAITLVLVCFLELPGRPDG